MRYIDYNQIDNPAVGDVYIEHAQAGQLMIWDGHRWVNLDASSIERRNRIIKDLEEDPELMNDVMVELRKRKIERLKR